MKKSVPDIVYYILIYSCITIAVLVTLYPFVYIISISCSSVIAIDKNLVTLLPVQFNLGGYKLVMGFSDFWVSYYNTIWYTVIGTALNIAATCLAAYPLSKRSFFLRKKLNFFIVFTMYFSGGLIPTYMLITNLHLYNSRWVMIIPTLVSTFNVMILRSAFEGIPNELFESASLDGANDIFQLFSVGIPLVKPTLAVLTLYYAVGHWNDFFNALLYLSDSSLQPLQIFLRRVLIMASPEIMQRMGNNTAVAALSTSTLQVRYVCIVVTVLPIVMVYPFIQKYFVKGATIGAVKG